MIKSIDQVMQTHPLVMAAQQLINYSVQLRQHGDKSYRDTIIRFQDRATASKLCIRENVEKIVFVEGSTE